MSRRHPVPAGVKYQWLPVVVSVLLYFAQEYQVISAVYLPHLAANKLRYHAIQDGHSGLSFYEVHARVFIRHGSGELSRKVMLFGFQNIDGKMSDSREIAETLRLPRQTPQDQRRVQ